MIIRYSLEEGGELLLTEYSKIEETPEELYEILTNPENWYIVENSIGSEERTRVNNLSVHTLVFYIDDYYFIWDSTLRCLEIGEFPSNKVVFLLIPESNIDKVLYINSSYIYLTYNPFK